MSYEQQDKNKALEGVVFSEKWQEAVFGHMMSDLGFFLRSRKYLESNWFSNPRIGTLYGFLTDFYNTENKFPTVGEFEALKLNTIIDGQERHRYKTTLDMCRISAQTISVQIVSKSMTGYIQYIKFKESTQKSIKLFNEGDCSKAISWIDQKIKEIKNSSFEDDGTYVFDNPFFHWKMINTEQKDGISTGSPILDKLLSGSEAEDPSNPGASIPLPGFKKRSMTVVIGPSNSGKTSLMTTFIKHAINQDKRVLFITHEGDEKQIANNIYKACLDMNDKEFSEHLKEYDKTRSFSTQMRDAIIITKEKIDKNLIYKPMRSTGALYVEDVIDNIKMINQNEISKGNKPFDMIIDDYPAKLFSKQLSNKEEKRNKDTYVYDQFQQLAIELNCHVIAPVQSNRAGYKQSKDSGGMIDMDSVAESFGITQVADQVLTINRSSKDKAAGRMYLYLAKSRSAQTGSHFWSQVDLSKSIMYAQGLPSSQGIGDLKLADVDDGSSNDG